MEIPYHRRLPLGVAILSVLIGIFGALLLLVGLLIVVVGGLAVLGHFAAFGASGLLAGGIVLVFAVLLLGVAVGLWRLELWALVLSIIVVVLLLASAALSVGIASIEGIVLILLLVYLIVVNGHFR